MLRRLGESIAFLRNGTWGQGSVLALVALLVFSGCRSTEIDETQFYRARFVIESTSSDGYAVQVVLPVSGVRVAVEGNAVLSEFDYESIEMVEVDMGKCLVFSLKPQAARAFYQLSVANQGKRLVLLINGDAVGARRIDGPISNGQVFVFLETTDDRLEEIAKHLKETNFDIQKKLSN